MVKLELDYDESVIDSLQLIWRREDIPRISRCEIYLSSVLGLRDKYNRGIGQVHATGYGTTVLEAYESGLAKLQAAITARLEARNALAPGAGPTIIHNKSVATQAADLLAELGL